MSPDNNKVLRHDVEMFKKYKNLLLELTRKNIKLKYYDYSYKSVSQDCG